ncbi:MAG: hypothetical protein LUD72_02790 [Bacteroidales bacterium]|nr:hypothetical protein [Bacteroidales bacterium]
MNPVAFTIRSEGIVKELITSVDIREAYMPADVDGVPEPLFLRTTALWDTGAIASVISNEGVQKLGLSPITQCKAYHAQGESLVNVYITDILLPNGILIKGAQVSEGRLNGFGMLIGMDIISLGDFALTHKDQKTVFSFQIPPTHEYDFVKQIQQGVGQKKDKRHK